MTIHQNPHSASSIRGSAVNLDDATLAATELRNARAKINVIFDSLRKVLGADIFNIISSSVDHNLRSVWLQKLVISLGDPSQMFFAVHAELDSGNARVVNQVKEAWGDIFEIETRPTWRDGILLTMRPKGGREATENDIRPATKNEIVKGNRVYIIHGDHKVLYENWIREVRDSSADYKGFYADDGRSYGLDGSVFILRIDDIPTLPRL